MLSTLFARKRVVQRRVVVDHAAADTNMVLVVHGFGTTDVDVEVSHADDSSCDEFRIAFWASDAVLVRFPGVHALAHAVRVVERG